MATKRCRFLLSCALQMINLYRDPGGKKIFDNSNRTESLEVGIPYTESEDKNVKAEMIQLQNKVREHEESIHRKDRKISELEKTLKNIEVRYIFPVLMQ